MDSGEDAYLAKGVNFERRMIHQRSNKFSAHNANNGRPRTPVIGMHECYYLARTVDFSDVNQLSNCYRRKNGPVCRMRSLRAEQDATELFNLRKERLMQNTKTPNGATIADLVSSEPRFRKFNEAIKTAGLGGKLAGEQEFTIFAPTNDAFAKLPKDKLDNLFKPANHEQLRKLLMLHIVPGALSADDLKQANAVKTEAGQEIKVTVSRDKNDIKLAHAKVILPKEEARNGCLYPLDAVLQPMTGAAATA